MPVLKKDGTPRAPRRTKAEMEAEKGRKYAPATTNQMTEMVRVWLMQELGAHQPRGKFMWVDPTDQDTTISKQAKVFWKNGDIRCEFHDWGIIFQPNVVTNRLTIRFVGNKKALRLRQLVEKLVEDMPWLRAMAHAEVSRVDDPGYIINTPLPGLSPKGTSAKTVKKGEAAQSEAYAGKLELGVTPPPKKGKAKK